MGTRRGRQWINGDDDSQIGAVRFHETKVPMMIKNRNGSGKKRSDAGKREKNYASIHSKTIIKTYLCDHISEKTHHVSSVARTFATNSITLVKEEERDSDLHEYIWYKTRRMKMWKFAMKRKKKQKNIAVCRSQFQLKCSLFSLQFVFACWKHDRLNSLPWTTYTRNRSTTSSAIASKASCLVWLDCTTITSSSPFFIAFGWAWHKHLNVRKRESGKKWNAMPKALPVAIVYQVV